MGTFGRQVLGTTGIPVSVIADEAPEYKIGGVTVDWGTVAAVNSDTVYPDGVTVRNGQKGLRFGTVLVRITGGDAAVITEGAGAAGGTFALRLGGHNTALVAYNVSAADLKTAVEALVNVGAGNATVTGDAGGPYTISLNPALGGLGAFTVVSNTVVDGASAPVAITVAALSGGGDYGYYGPADTRATDGRQTVDATRIGEVVVVTESILQNLPFGFGANTSDHPAVIGGGRVWKARLLVGGSNQPTLANLLAAMPRLVPVEM